MTQWMNSFENDAPFQIRCKIMRGTPHKSVEENDMTIALTTDAFFLQEKRRPGEGNFPWFSEIKSLFYGKSA